MVTDKGKFYQYLSQQKTTDLSLRSTETMDHIGNLPISQRFDQGEDAHGALKILQPRQGPNTSERISDAACLVLALNDLTCEEGGVGKVDRSFPGDKDLDIEIY